DNDRGVGAREYFFYYVVVLIADEYVAFRVNRYARRNVKARAQCAGLGAVGGRRYSGSGWAQRGYRVTRHIDLGAGVAYLWQSHSIWGAFRRKAPDFQIMIRSFVKRPVFSLIYRFYRCRQIAAKSQ